MKIYCCSCSKKVNARLTDGKEVYPHLLYLHKLPFWICDSCKNFVGCHHKTKNRTRPLGCIPTQELKKARTEIHKILDPLWHSGKISRKEVYAHLSKKLGWKYHTANIRTIKEARTIRDFNIDQFNMKMDSPEKISIRPEPMSFDVKFEPSEDFYSIINEIRNKHLDAIRKEIDEIDAVLENIIASGFPMSNIEVRKITNTVNDDYFYEIITHKKAIR